jgi:biotin transport system substrate-specific component
MFNTKLTTRELCLCAVFAAITAVMAQIQIPMPLGVPMTMQTFAVILAGVVLGPRGGFLSMLVYILMGAVGIPVFNSFQGGIGMIFGRTGGFILTFPFMALISGLGARRDTFIAPRLRVIRLAVCITIGTVVNLGGGMLMFMIVMGTTLEVAFAACVVPFIPGAVIKGAGAGILGQKLKHIKKATA